jgi:hypothetical protein
VSRQAIAAALAREDLSAGDRLVAFSLASFADCENRAWPGAPAAAARAGLRRSRYLEAREQLVRRGLVIVEQAATGRGRCSRLALTFAIDGPWYEGEINAGLFEAVLGYSSARGPARVLLAAMAALADGEGFVEDLSTEQLCVAAGLADRTYRRARQALLASGEVMLLSGVGGRGNTNRWQVPDPRQVAAEPSRPSSGRRVVPPACARPLVVALGKPRPEAPPTEVDAVVAGVADVSGNGDVGSVKGGQDRTLFDPDGAKTPAETPAETPAPNARAGRNPRTPEPQNQNTTPPSPPEGGSSHESITIEETYLTDRGRRRRRRVNVNLDEVRRTLGVPGPADHAAWQRTRELLVERVGESTFEIWLDAVGMVAVDTDDGALVLDGPDGTRGWVCERYGAVIAGCAELAGATVKFASEAQVVAVGAR